MGKSSGSSNATGYLYENGNIILETNGKNLVTAKNVWGSRLLERDTQDETYSYLFDGHGDITALTDKLGNVLKDYSYDPYGNALAKSSAPKSYSKQADKDYNNPFQYCGEYSDGETGFYYLRARFYDPAIGRFLSEDTYRGQATNTLSLNLYTYCEGNPVKYTDSNGHNAILIGLGIGTAICPGIGTIIGAVIGVVATVVIIVIVKDQIDNAATADYINSYDDYTYSASEGTQTADQPEEDNPSSSGPTIYYPGDDQTQPPGEGYEWRGSGDPGSGKGSWYNPDTDESLHPDLDHPEPYGPHYDYDGPAGKYRVYPDGTVEPKD